jgi:GNAT superfamily N-acetyltransferase
MLPNERDVFETTYGDYELSTDRERLDINYVFATLHDQYWGKDITQEMLERSIQGSIAFGVYQSEKQVGFAQVITDGAMFAYLLNVVIDPAHRGKGLGKFLAEITRNHPDLKSVMVWRLWTADAQGIYKRAGWETMTKPEGMMEIIKLPFEN